MPMTARQKEIRRNAAYARELKGKGVSYEAIKQRLGISDATLSRYLNDPYYNLERIRVMPTLINNNTGSAMISTAMKLQAWFNKGTKRKVIDIGLHKYSLRLDQADARVLVEHIQRALATEGEDLPSGPGHTEVRNTVTSFDAAGNRYSDGD